MATVTTSDRSRSLSEASQRVRSPLERLRNFIRLYVSLEGAAVVGLFLALWFWIGLILDYGVFRLFHIDWVQELPWGVRCGLLALIVSGLAAAVIFKVLTRLFREFRDSALALVLERRFPNILGDRLITAVELADAKKAADIGYSPAMVQETIREAASRVEQLKIKEVFDWRRLKHSGFVVAVLVIVGYLLVGFGFCGVNAMQRHGFALAGFNQFHDVSGIWFERNVLLHNVIWPRQAHMEYLDVPPMHGEYRIGRGERGPTIRVRALKYVIAGAPSAKAVDEYRAWLDSRGVGGEERDNLLHAFEKKPAEGWRALSWFDLTPELLGDKVPVIDVPEDWKIRDLGAGLTLDEIELNLDKPETHKTLSADTKDAMRGVLEILEERATDPALSRVLRKLSLPDEALLIYKGNTTSSQTTMQRLADNEYTGQFGDLKETVTYYVKGLDYYTAARRVVVVEPPALDDLVRVEERPAYLYYRLRKEDNPDRLSGQKQIFREAKVSLQGGEVSRIDVPAGTNITLTATASKDLQAVTIEAHKAHKAGIPLTASPPKMLDERTFSTRFDNVRFQQNFVFHFTDTDGVSGRRHVVLVPMEDAPPKIRELAPDEIVRKVQGGFMVTVSARIPFKGQVDDDRGLTAVRYAYTIAQFESARTQRRAAWPILGGASLAPHGQGLLPGLLDLAVTVFAANRKIEKKTDQAVEYFALPSFKKALEDSPVDAFQHPDTVREELAKPQKEPYRQLLRNFKLEADKWTQPDLDPIGCDLPLWKNKPDLKMSDPSRPQPRYQMQIWLEAVDTDLDSDKDKDGKPQPHVKVSEEKFTFFLVSENELLTEIAKEEEKLHADLNQKYDDLLETQAKLVRVNLDLSSDSVKEVELGAMSARAEQVGEVLEKSQNTAREVYAAYARILKEMQANQINEKFLQRVEKSIVEPLQNVDGVFNTTREKVNAFRAALDGKNAALPQRIAVSRQTGAAAKEQMRVLMLELDKILAAMMKMKGINDLVKHLVEIERNEAEQYDIIKKLYDKRVEDLFENAMEDDKP